LNEVGFLWDPITDTRNTLWENGFASLLIFKERENHCNVYYSHKEGVYPLGSWVKQQRRYKDKMSKERRERLEALNGWIWNAKP
jgi:hypothetical protein